MNQSKKIITAVLLFALCVPGLLSSKDKQVSYEKDLKPIFEKSCYKCHGPKKQKGSLRLDSIKHLKTGAKNGPVAIPGEPEESSLYTLTILPEDDDDVMPSKGDMLTKEQTELIRLWIVQGAKFEDGTSLKTKKEQIKKDTRVTVLDQLSSKVPAPSATTLKQFEEIGVKIQYLSKNKHFIGLDFSQLKKSVKLSDDHLNKLEKVSKQLIALDLGTVDLSKKKLKVLAKLHELRRLHLERTKISDKALGYIKGLKKLEYLNLYETQVTDKGLENLKGLTQLKNLYLWNTKVSKGGAEKLKALLSKVKINLG